MFGAKQVADAFLLDVRVVLFECVGETEGDDRETGVVVGAGFGVAVFGNLKFTAGVFEDVLAFGAVDVAYAGVPAGCFKGFAKEAGVCAEGCRLVGVIVGRHVPLRWS